MAPPEHLEMYSIWGQALDFLGGDFLLSSNPIEKRSKLLPDLPYHETKSTDLLR